MVPLTEQDYSIVYRNAAQLIPGECILLQAIVMKFKNVFEMWERLEYEIAMD